jgi:hypothetical protein
VPASIALIATLEAMTRNTFPSGAYLPTAPSGARALLADLVFEAGEEYLWY